MTLSAHRDEEELPIEPIARTLPMDFFAAAVPKERKPVPAGPDIPVLAGISRKCHA